LTVQLNTEEFLDQIEGQFDRLRKNIEKGNEQLGRELEQDVILNIILGYVLDLNWKSISTEYMDYRIKRGKIPIPSGHLLDEQLMNAVQRNFSTSNNGSVSLVYVNEMQPRPYEVFQEFGFTSYKGNWIEPRPFFQPALDKIIEKFMSFLREHVERSI